MAANVAGGGPPQIDTVLSLGPHGGFSLAATEWEPGCQR
jgi:hypothetical protein